MAHLGVALASPTTRVYVDTSFLMWMTRIGSVARGELTRWLGGLCGVRLRVPVWAAHEYYRHHSETSLLNDLTETLERLEKAAASAYAEIWPLLDEPLGEAASAQTQRTELRDVLRAVPGVSDMARRWMRGYQRHAREVIEFINENALDGSPVPAYFGSIEALATARFTGRVPPGFKDRGKRERKDTAAAGDGSSVGSNRWGDLVFWKEVLDDSRRRRAGRIVILTRDAKNDWRMAGSLPVQPEAGGERGVSPAHPFLTFEAAREAGAEEVLLADQTHLAAVAKAGAEAGTAAFVFVAQPPGLPTPETESQRRDKEVHRERSTRASIRSSMAARDGVLYLDPPDFRASSRVLRRALLESRAGTATPQTVLDFEASLERTGEASVAALTEEAVTAMGGSGIAILARRLGRAATGSGAAAATVLDLAQALQRFPAKVAGALYFGLLAEAYFDPSNNRPRPAPASTALQTLFKHQTEPWALPPIQAVSERLRGAERLPLYIPDPTAPRISMSCHAHGDQEPPTRLRTLRVRGLELITPAQGTPELRLGARLHGEPATALVLLQQAADLYGLPLEQLDLSTDLDGAYQFDPMVGFKSPAEIWLDPLELRL